MGRQDSSKVRKGAAGRGNNADTAQVYALVFTDHLRSFDGLTRQPVGRLAAQRDVALGLCERHRLGGMEGLLAAVLLRITQHDMTTVQDFNRAASPGRQDRRGPAGMGPKTQGRLAGFCSASHVHSLARDRQYLALAAALDLCVKLQAPARKSG